MQAALVLIPYRFDEVTSGPDNLAGIRMSLVKIALT